MKMGTSYSLSNTISTKAIAVDMVADIVRIILKLYPNLGELFYWKPLLKKPTNHGQII
jgi:hypothetical protein